MDLNDHVSFGQTWEVTVFSLAGPLDGAFGYTGNNQRAFHEAAWLFSQSLLPSSQTNDIQSAINRAIWSLFPGVNGGSESYLNSPAANAWLAAAHTQIFSMSFLSDFVVYSPTVPGVGQAFIGQLNVPEPSTYATIAAAFIALIAFNFRRRAN